MLHSHGTGRIFVDLDVHREPLKGVRKVQAAHRSKLRVNKAVPNK